MDGLEFDFKSLKSVTKHSFSPITPNISNISLEAYGQSKAYMICTQHGKLVFEKSFMRDIR